MFKRPRVYIESDNEDSPSVEVEIDFDDSADCSTKATKKGGRPRGRPKAVRSYEFEVMHSHTTNPDSDQAQQRLRERLAAPNVPLGAPKKPGDSSGVNSSDIFGHNSDEPGYPDEKGKRGNKSNRTPNNNLKEWLENCCSDYLTAWYNHDNPPPSKLTPCSHCMHETGDLYRCTTCIGAGWVCPDCVKSIHRYTPTHRIKRWGGASWVEAHLSDPSLGHTLCLGPHWGEHCPKNPNCDPSNLYIGDLNGFTHAKSALTFQLLDMHNLLTTVGQTSSHKYYSVLQRFSKPRFPKEVDNRYRELMWTHRRYLYLLLLRRSGHTFPLHPHIDTHPGDQAFDCVACPRPGFNFEWFKVAPDEVVWFRAWFSYDGNFRMVRKAKKVATGDLCLSDGCGYIPAKEGYQLWTETVPQPKRTVKPSCDHHKAGNDENPRWIGNDVTGISAISCTPHTCIAPRGVVDFFKGERFIYADYAFALLLTYLFKRRGPFPIGFTYDVMCHWIASFGTRRELLPDSIKVSANLDLVVAIPKWHLIGHERECFIRYSLDHTLYVGRLEGEGTERFWAIFNQFSGSTSEQGPGVRSDSMNNIIRAWNEEKAFTMDQTLPTCYEDGRKSLAKHKEIHDDLTKSLPDEVIQDWEKESTEPVKGTDGKWTSPMMDPTFTGGFYDTIKEERQKESPTARGAGKRPGAVRWLSDGIKLEHAIQKYNDDAKELGGSPSNRQAGALNTRRIALGDRVRALHKKREQFAVEAPDVDHPQPLTFYDEDDDAVELGMPSSYKLETLQASPTLTSLCETEKELRRAMCRESLQSVKRLLASRAAAYKSKNQVRGQVAMTRARASIKAHDDKIDKAAWRYNNSHRALIRLGMSKEDAELFKALSNEDLVPLKAYFEEYAEHVSRKNTMSWIWRSSAAPNDENWQVEALKTEWFRSREHYKRWHEQLVLLKREMVMTIRSFLRYQELWEWKANVPNLDVTSSMRAYAHGRSCFFRALALRMLIAFHKPLYDDTVVLKWASDWLRTNVIVDGNHVNFIRK